MTRAATVTGNHPRRRESPTRIFRPRALRPNDLPTGVRASVMVCERSRGHSVSANRVQDETNAYLRWRIFARIRRFFRPTLRRPVDLRRPAIPALRVCVRGRSRCRGLSEGCIIGARPGPYKGRTSGSAVQTVRSGGVDRFPDPDCRREFAAECRLSKVGGAGTPVWVALPEVRPSGRLDSFDGLGRRSDWSGMSECGST
jgi:hypothetical protein